MGLGGIVSFGHAAFFGLGAYSVALAIKHLAAPFAVALLLAPISRRPAALLVGPVVLRVTRRLRGDVDARICADSVVDCAQWVEV